MSETNETTSDRSLTPEQAVEVLKMYSATHAPLTYGLSKKLFEIAGLDQSEPYIPLDENATDEEKTRAQEQLKAMTDDSLIYI
ncbi:hypothetical protein [Paenibacillus sp. FSL W8-1287]|uniref:hypothetical protein n=1 Tax=Paenibacillus sp. FSL W8-1287 TaxID=2954653 RepID=UPI0030D05DF6